MVELFVSHYLCGLVTLKASMHTIIVMLLGVLKLCIALMLLFHCTYLCRRNKTIHVYKCPPRIQTHYFRSLERRGQNCHQDKQQHIFYRRTLVRLVPAEWLVESANAIIALKILPSAKSPLPDLPHSSTPKAETLKHTHNCASFGRSYRDPFRSALR